MIQFKPMTTQYEWDFFKEKTHVIRCEDTQGIVAYNADGIQAMAVFDTWTTDSCCVHLCIVNPLVLRRGFFTEVANHLFNTCGRARIFGLVPSNNKKAIKLNTHIGWEEVARIPDGVCTGVDTIIVRMEREDCRWLSKEIREAA